MIDYTPHHQYEEIIDYIPPKKDVVRGKIIGYLLLLFYIAIVCWFITIILQSDSVLLFIKNSIVLGIIALFVGVIFVIIHWLSSPPRPRLKANYASVIKNVIGFDFGNDFKLLYTSSHDYEEYLYIFSEESFGPLKKHLESIPNGKDDNTGRVVNHSFKGEEGQGFSLVENRLGSDYCGNIESIDVDYRERTLKHKFVIY